LNFSIDSGNAVKARLYCSDIFQSYSGYLHGGVASLLLDGAMTNCLFTLGKKAVTGKLNIRYLQPVFTNRNVEVRAKLEKSFRHIHYLEATISQDEKVLVKGKGVFMERP